MSNAIANSSQVQYDLGSGVRGGIDPSPPATPGLTGTFSEGNTITLAGSGFGSDGVPIIYDDFESGTVGDDLNTRGWVTSVNNGPVTPPSVSSNQFYSGTRSGEADISAGGDCSAYLENLNLTEIYCSFYSRTDQLTGPSETVKGWRVHSDQTTNQYTGYPGIFEQEPIDVYSNRSHRFTVQTLGTSADGPNSASYYTSAQSENVWQRLEYYVKISDPGVANGKLVYTRDLTVHENQQAIVTRETGITEVIELMMLPFFWGGGGTGMNWYDNVIVSATQARIEVGDSATYASCTKKEVMNTLTRVDGQITFKVPSNTFSTGSTVYVHVIDVAGSSTANYSTVVV